MKEKPTKKDKQFLGQIEYSHPAYGTIGMSRITCQPPQQLFGSSVKHGNFIALRISQAVRSTEGNYDHISTGKELIEVYLSGTQLGDLLTSMNVGEGVPCTINHINRESIPGIEDENTPITESREAFTKRITAMCEKSVQLLARVQGVCDTPKAISKADMKEIKGYAYSIQQDLTSNLPWMATCFDEKIEKTVQHAKGEVESFVSNIIARAGIKSIQDSKGVVEFPYQLTHKKDDPDKTD